MIVSHDSSYSASRSRDLSFTLGTPLTSLATKEKPSVWNSIDWQSLAGDEAEFYQSSSKRIQEISSLLKELEDASKYQLNLETAQKIYALAQDLKRHESSRSILWNALPKAQQIFLHQLVLWSEDLKVLKEPIPYQWLGDGQVERAYQSDAAVTDFGDGRLFKVQPASCLGEHSEFPLTQYPDCHLVKASPDQKQLSRVNLMTPMMTLNTAAIGRLTETFDVQALEAEIKKGEESSTLSINQLLDVFSCYRSALCSVLDLPVHLPLAIGRRGEWAIWNNKKEQWKGKPLSSSMVHDLHRLLQMEKLWKINVFNASPSLFNPQFAVCDDHLVVDGILPLPTFLSSNIQVRHQSLFKTLKLDTADKEQLGKLEEAAKAEEEKMTHLLQCLKFLVEKKSLSLQDLATLQPQALLIVRLMRLIDGIDRKKTPLQFPVTTQLFLDIARKMLAGLTSKKSPVPYTSKQISENKGEHLTNLLLNSKKELKLLMLLVAIEKFEKKDSPEEMIQTLLQLLQEKCQEAAKELNSILASDWPFKESVEEHFMFLFDEGLEEFNQILQQPCDDQASLYDKLLLLRAAIEYPEAEVNNLNRCLQSVLHDAMVQKYSQTFLSDLQQHMQKFPYKFNKS